MSQDERPSSASCAVWQSALRTLPAGGTNDIACHPRTKADMGRRMTEGLSRGRFQDRPALDLGSACVQAPPYWPYLVRDARCGASSQQEGGPG